MMENARLIRRAQVEERTGIRRAYLYQLIAEGRFPKPVKIGRRSVAWVVSEVQQWIDDRINEGRCASERKAG